MSSPTTNDWPREGAEHLTASHGSTQAFYFEEATHGREAGLTSCVQEYALTSAMMLQGPLTRIAANPPLFFFSTGRAERRERMRKKQREAEEEEIHSGQASSQTQHGQIMPALDAGEGASLETQALRARSFVDGQA